MAFHSNPFLGRHFGYDEDFDVFFEGQKDGYKSNSWFSLRRIQRFFSLQPYINAAKLNHIALPYLTSPAGSRPVFAWIHYMDVHGPYFDEDCSFFSRAYANYLFRKAVLRPHSLSALESRYLKNLYRKEVQYIDYHIGCLLNQLKNHKSSWLVILTSDHGESLGEQQCFTHNRNLYESLVHIPLLFFYTGKSETLRDNITKLKDRPTGLIDIAPTIFELLFGCSAAIGNGRSLLTGNRDFIFSEIKGEKKEAHLKKYACISARYKCIMHVDDSTNRPIHIAIFDLLRDPLEQNDLCAIIERKNPCLLEDIKNRLLQHIAQERCDQTDELTPYTAGKSLEQQETRKKLEALGYF